MKPKRVTAWILSNAVILVCAYYGLFQHVVWAENMLLFIVWSSTFLWSGLAFHKESKLKLREKGPSVPPWLSTTTDVIVMLALASVGRFFSAAAMLWQISAEANVWEKEEPKCESLT